MGHLRRRIIDGVTRFLPALLPASRQYYNATNNDRWIVEYIFPGKRNGYFLEAGAANGKEASSCYILEQELGWTGICVEPSDYFFDTLVINRPQSICERVCLSDRAGTVTYIEGSDETVSPYLSGIKSNLETVKYQGNEVVQKGSAVEKPAVTLGALLDKYNAPKVIDYAAFDIEGSELDVLSVFPFDRYTFLALSLECDGSIREPITALLTAHGYRSSKNPFNRDKPWELYWLHESIC
jgi:hypothetical protein